MVSRSRRRHPVSKEYLEGKEEIDEKTREALRRMGKVGSAVRWGYMSPSDTESEIDESMHKAMSRLGKKGAAVRWGRIAPHEEEVPPSGRRMRAPKEEEEEEVPKFRARKREPEQFARHPPRKRARRAAEEEEEEYPRREVRELGRRGRPGRMWPPEEEEEEEETEEEEEEEEEEEIPSGRGAGRYERGGAHKPVSAETHEKLHRAGLKGASARWGYDYLSEEEEGERPAGRRRRKHAPRYWLR